MSDVTPGKKKVAVGLSGGVDSSVAASLLKDRGYDVHGFFLECWWTHVGCSSEKDREDAIRVAAKLDIPIKVLDYKTEYKKRVIDYFYKSYEQGLTPNPDIMCNKVIKFGEFYNHARKLGFDYIATGHYVRIDVGGLKIEAGKEGKVSNFQPRSEANPASNIQSPTSDYRLLRGIDESKDQSYFLYTLRPDQLPHILFPVGDLTKKEVRKIAKEKGLHTAKKPDSQGICFVGEVDIEEFLKERLPEKEGKVLNTKGEVVGKHKGAYFYTIGQRRGFELTKYLGVPVYVVSKNVEDNTITVGIGRDTERNEFTVANLHWINRLEVRSLKLEARNESGGLKTESRESNLQLQSEADPASNIQPLTSVNVRVRHLGELIPCKLEIRESGNQVLCTLELPQRGIAPGQHAVFYHQDEVLGGGVIMS